MRGRGGKVARVVLLAAALGLVAGPAPAAEPKAAPPFRVRALSGETLDLGELTARGPVLLDFWATWCKPCLASLPELETLHRRFAPRGLTVIGISVDGPRNFAKVRPFARRLGLTFPIALDEDGGLQRLYQARAIPSGVLVSAEGRVVHVSQGWRPGETGDLARAIEALLPDTTAVPRP